MPIPHRPHFFAGFVLALTAASALAQTTPAATAPPAPASESSASTSPAKKELIQRVLKLQQPAVDRLATALTQEPAIELGQRASEAIAMRVPKERQEALAKDIQGDIQKYLKDTVPMVRKSAQQLAPSAVGPLLEAKFSEEELRQVVNILESPAYAKYQQLGGEMQQALQLKLVADTRTTVEPKVQALEKVIGDKIAAADQAAGGTAPKAPASKPSSSKGSK